MKVLLLNSILMYIQNEVAKKEQKIVAHESGIQFIVDADYCETLDVSYDGDMGLKFSDSVSSEKVHCILLVEDLEKTRAGVSFMFLGGAVNGILVIDNEVQSEEELEQYSIDYSTIE